MTASASPVSAFLEQRLLAELQAKKIVVWLDADGAYTPFVDELRRRAEARQFSTPVLPFRGSFLEMMLALRTEGSTIDKPPMLLHLPGFNTESIRKTPVLEMYECGAAFQQNLATLVREAANGRLPLPDIEAFVAAPGLSLEKADAWLARAGSASVDTHAEWVSRLEAPELVNHLTGTSPDRPDGVIRALQARAEALFGTDAAWFSKITELTESVVAWLLCVEFVHDLRRPPRDPDLTRLQALPPPTVKRCQAEAARLRQMLPDQYRTWALGVETLLKDKEETDPKDLGRIDTFQFEALSIYQGAVAALASGDYRQALHWAQAHEASQGFWVQHEPPRRWAWALVGEAARLGVALLDAPRPLSGATSLEEAVQRYVESAAPVDRAHREFEQRFAALYGPLLPELTALDQAFEKLRFAHADWSDRLARDFAQLCRQTGSLPPPEIQQRTLFDQVIAPLLGRGEPVALFVLDALRFEMALELQQEFKGSGVHVDLRARLAELPTVTSVGMNALAPVGREGRLFPVIKEGRFEGFRTGEALVARPDDRVKAMATRTEGRAPLHLRSISELLETPVARLKSQLSRRELIIVHGQELDEAGESGLGVRVFQDVLRDIVSARHHLELAGVSHFVFTADHGFLLGRGRKAHSFGTRGQAQRRYAYSDTDRTDPGHFTLPLSTLGYEAQGFLVFREDTAEYDVGRPPGSFTHGGNSLQERVIPVLQLSRTRASRETVLRFTLQCDTAPGGPGVHRLRVRASPAREPGQAPLAFASSQPVDVMLRVPQRGDVRVVPKDIIGPGASAHAGGVRLDAATHDWTEISFVLEGAVDERLPVEVVLASDANVKASPSAFYSVSYVAPPQPTTSRAPATSSAPEAPGGAPKPLGGWGARLGDEDAGKVFDHLERFGSLNEGELVHLLGNARRARSFAARFDAFRDKLTFEVQVSMTLDGKRYERL